MAVLVGDIIQKLRETAIDQPQTYDLFLQGGTFQSATAIAAGALVPFPQGGAYTVTYTAVAPWGESAQLFQQSGLAIAAGQVIQIPATTGQAFLGFPFSKVRVYISQRMYEIALVNSDIPATVIAGNTPITGRQAPPQVSRCYNPDSDGQYLGAFQVFSWLNEAIVQGGKAVGGFYDASGVQTQVGQPIYQLLSNWVRIAHVWWDGWYMDKGNASNIFRRNPITAISGSVTLTKAVESTLLELFPQPNRTGGTDTLSAQLLFSDTAAALTGGGATIQIEPGLALIGAEIVGFQSSGAGLSGLIRGLGGTVPTTWPIGTAVTELNLRVAGYRIPQTNYVPGQSNLPLSVPPGMEGLLYLYMLSKFRDTEQENSGQQLRKSFFEECKTLQNQLKPIVGPRQIGPPTGIGEVWGGTAGGGWLLP